MTTLCDILDDLKGIFFKGETGELEIDWSKGHMVIHFDGSPVSHPFQESYTWVKGGWVCSTDWDMELRHVEE